MGVNHIALRTAKTPLSFGRSECNRVKGVRNVHVAMPSKLFSLQLMLCYLVCLLPFMNLVGSPLKMKKTQELILPIRHTHCIKKSEDFTVKNWHSATSPFPVIFAGVR